MYRLHHRAKLDERTIEEIISSHNINSVKQLSDFVLQRTKVPPMSKSIKLTIHRILYKEKTDFNIIVNERIECTCRDRAEILQQLGEKLWYDIEIFHVFFHAYIECKTKDWKKIVLDYMTWERESGYQFTKKRYVRLKTMQLVFKK